MRPSAVQFTRKLPEPCRENPRQMEHESLVYYYITICIHVEPFLQQKRHNLLILVHPDSRDLPRNPCRGGLGTPHWLNDSTSPPPPCLLLFLIRALLYLGSSCSQELGIPIY
jgi:hypothetical protein